ncbi:MAG: winged helix-turn-helix domain-containing protein, partial [Myxococcota bacterium]
QTYHPISLQTGSPLRKDGVYVVVGNMEQGLGHVWAKALTEHYQAKVAIRRSDARVPILMLTARSQEIDKVRGLDSGADDYVTKPFSVNELVARVRALLRRSQADFQKDAPMAIGDAIVDPVRSIVRRGDDERELNHHEVKLLRLLWARAGQAVTREEIMARVWDGETSSARSVDNAIVRLRKKLEATPDKPRCLLTVYGVGYKLVP